MKECFDGFAPLAEIYLLACKSKRFLRNKADTEA